MHEMKSWPVVVVALVALALGAVGLLRPQNVQLVNSPDADHTLAVVGEGRLEVKPDEASIVIGVTERAVTAQEAQAQANAAAAAIIDAVKAGGVSEDQLRTVSMRLDPEYQYSQNEAPKLIGYIANMGVQVRTKDIESLGPVIDAAVAAGANEVRQIQFSVRDEEQHRQQAIDAAVADARKKADATAAKLGTEVVGIKSVQVQEGGSPGGGIGITFATVERMATDSAQVMPGTQDYRVHVAVTFIVK